MKKVFFLLIMTALLVGGCMQAKRLTVLEMPEPTETQVTPIDVTPYLEKYAGYDGVYLELEYTVEHSGDKDDYKRSLLGMFAPSGWDYTYIYKSKKMIINPEAAWMTTLEFPYSKPDKLYMRVIAPDGKVQTFGSADLVKFKDSERDETYKFIYPNIQKGTIVEVGYDYTYSAKNYFPSLEEDFALQFRVPCEKLDVSFAYPDWWTIAIKRIGKDKFIPVDSTHDVENKKKIITYHATDVPGLEFEPYGPYYKDMADYLNLHVTSLNMMGTSWKRAESWGDFIKDFRKYNIKKSDKWSDDLYKLLDSLTADCHSQYEKLDAINDYIVTTIESDYVDYDGNPTKIIKNKKGNVFEITSLAEQMLSKVGIAGRYILVHDGSEGYFDPDFITSSQLLYPALHVLLDSTEYVLFPYIERLPTGIIPEPAQGQPAVVATEVTANRLWTVPSISRTQNAEDRTSEVTIDSTGRVTVCETRILRGSDAYHMRENIRNFTPEELRDSLLAQISFPGVIVKLDSFNVKNEQEYRSPLEIGLYYSSDNSVAFAGDDIILQTAGILAPVSYILPYSDSAQRKNPIEIENDSYMHRHLIVSYPPGWEIATPLEDVDYSNQFGAIKGTYLRESGRFVVEQELTLNRSGGPKEQYNDLVTLIGTTPKTWVPSIVFKKPTSATVPDEG